MESAPHPWPTLGVLLLRDGLVTKEELEAVLAEHDDTRKQRISGRRLGEVLVERGHVTQVQVAELVAEQYELPFVDLDVSDIDLDVAVLLDEELSRRFSAVPIGARPDGSYLLAIGDPAAVVFSDELRRVLGASPRFAVVGSDALEAAIEFVHNRSERIEALTASEPRTEPLPHVALVPEPANGRSTAPAAATGSDAYFGTQRAVAHLWPPLGALLIRESLVSDEELETALAQQRLSASSRLGEILVDRGTVSRGDIARLVAEQYELPFVEVDRPQIDPAAAELLPEDIARRYSALPIDILPDGSLRVVVADPTNVVYSNELQLALGVPLSFAVADPDAIEEAIASFYGRAPIVDDAGEETSTAAHEDADLDRRPEEDESAAPEIERLAEVFPPDQDFDLDETEVETGESDERHIQDIDTTAPAVAAVEEAIERALALGATALHVSPQPTGLVVRARVDGVMRELETIPSSLQASITSRLKPATKLHLGEDSIDVRVDVLPTKEGEKLTLHVTHPDRAASLADLGMAPDSEEALRRAIDARLGAILFCGPTGSGRTTTFHAALRALNTPERQLTTIEDPVHRVIPGIDQVEVDEAANVTFARGLCAILRSDPDVLGVGEIQDEGTARLVVDAAMTNGLVLATLRARTASAAIRHLTDIGVNPRLLGSALVCVVAQRLARRVCSECREGYYADPEELARLGRPAETTSPRLLARGRGCAACGGTGFRGRVGIFEILTLTEEIRRLVVDGASTAEVQAVAAAAGMRTLREDGVRLCLEGVTTVAEVQRVVEDG